MILKPARNELSIAREQVERAKMRRELHRTLWEATHKPNGDIPAMPYPSTFSDRDVFLELKDLFTKWP